MFRTDCKKFYKRLRQTYPNVNNSEKNGELLERNIWEKVQQKGEAGWIKKPVPTKFKH